MSDLDTLIVTFQTQLSDVMETVVKTAMYEVTRLVEDGFLEEMQRRDREVESLRMQLRWAERKLTDQDGKEGERSGRCVDCATDDVELSSDTAEEMLEEQQDDIVEGSDMKEEGDCMERWALSCTQAGLPESKQAADSPVCTLSPERKSQTEEEDDGVSEAVDVKEEEAIKPSCSSVHWSGSLDGPESHSATEMTEARLRPTQEDTEELLGDVLKQDLQISAAYVLPEDQDEMHVATDPALEEDSGWAGLTVTAAGLLHNHRLASESDPAKTRSLLKQMEHELSNSVAADVDVQVTPGRDQILVCAAPKTRLQNTDVLGVTVKQEVIVDSDECVESQPEEKKTSRFGMVSFSRSVKQHRASSETLRQNHISHKATVQEVMKLHSKVGAGLRLQAAIQHLHRPMKRLPHTHSSSAAAPSAAHSHVGNSLNRSPSTSKAAAPPSLPSQRAHLGDKQASAHNRTGAPWVSIKMHQTANSHHSNASPPDSDLHAGPRHILRCGQCGKCFPHPSNLKAHLQTHTGERPFCCSLCGRSFTKLSNLKAHRRVHTGERPYCCLACGKRFTQKCNLKRHQRIHLDV